jgi:hypothetical protein
MSNYQGKESIKCDDFVDEDESQHPAESFDALKGQFDLKSIMTQFIIK